ncbi:MAG: hypothetical protein ACO3VO_10770 [Ilumatobacteraceae bacterium]
METFALIAVGVSHIILAIMYRRLDERACRHRELANKLAHRNMRLERENARLKRIVTR